MADGKSTKRAAKPRRSAAAEAERLAAEKEAAEDRVFALTHRVAALEGRERDLNELIIGHRERIASLEAERDAFAKELERGQAEVEAIRERERQLADDLASARERGVALETERGPLGERLDEEKRRSDRLAAREIERDARLAQARERIAELERNRDLAKLELERAEQRSVELQDRESELVEQLSDHRGRITTLQAEIETQRERTAEEQRRHGELASELGGRAERIASLEAEREALRNELDLSRGENEALREREREIQGRTVILHEQVARLEAEEEMLSRTLAEERTARSALEQQEARIHPQLETARERIRALETERAELREGAERRERDLRVRVEAVQEQVGTLEDQRETLERVIAEEQGKGAALEEREAELGGARERIAALQAERAELSSKLEGEQRTLAELREREDELGEEIAALRERESDLQATLEDVREQVNRLEVQRTSMVAERDQLTSERNRLRSRLEQLESSRTYRMMRLTWRMRARVRHPFRRSARPALAKGRKPAKAERPAKPAPALTSGDQPKPKSKSRPMPMPTMRKPAKPAPAVPEAPAAPERKAEPVEEPAAEPERAPEPKAPEQAPEPESAPEPQPVMAAEELAERQRWLAKPQAPPNDVRQLRVAGILDEMSAACFGPDCDLLRIESEGWAEALEAHEPHLLLVESAWQGNDGSWQYMVASYTHPDYIGLPNLKDLIAWCRERDIPTVFWNKEDPVHFERFKEAAALFDYVFTTDANCIERYVELEREGSGPVSSLQFAAQPRVHNPIGSPVERGASPVFAGAYYRDRHIDRQKSLQMLLDAAMPFGLEIYDRRFGHEDKAFGFPERFSESVKGALPYEEMINAYKSHRVFLNVNSVQDSPTMFSRRVFELLACGTAVVSTESIGVERTLGDVVSMVETPEEATEALTELQDEDYWRELSRRGRRRVIGEHTYRHRLAEIANTLGFNVSAYPDERVAALALVDDVEQARRLRAVVASISAQETRPAELLIGSHTSVAGDLQELPDAGDEIRVRVVQQDPEATRSQRYRELAALAASRWLAILHPAHTYGEHHLTDLILSTRFADADVIGNASFETTEGSDAIDRSLENRFVDSVHPHSVLVARTLVARRGWPDDVAESGDALGAWFREGVRIYSGEAGNFEAEAALGLPERAATAASERSQKG